jgi:SOS response regulatory protein OraA/RecX
MVRDIDHAKPIVDYLKKNLAKGYKPQNLKWALISEGYSKIEVEKAMRIVEEENEKEFKMQELRAKKEMEKQAAELITDEMPVQVEKEGFWSKVKGWFG